MSLSNTVSIHSMDGATAETLALLSAEELSNLSDEIDEMAASAKRKRSLLNQAIKEKFDPKFDGGTGTVRESCDVEGGKVEFVFTIPKKVEWDNDALASIEKEADQWGKPLWSYMKIKRTVSNQTYEEMDAPLQLAFDKARTVKPGPMTIKIERKDS